MTIVPVILEWIAQWNGYVPAAEKTSPSDLPAARVGVAHCPPSRVAVCGLAPPFVKAMTCPVLAVMSVGWNEKDDGGVLGKTGVDGDWVWQ